MALLNVKITGNTQVLEKMRKLGPSLYDLAPAMEEIGKMQAEFYGNEAFNSRGGVYGEPWEPLSPGYQAWKSQNYPGRSMEEQTGKMRKSFGWVAGLMQVVIRNTRTVSSKKGTYNLLTIQQKGSESRHIPPRLIMALEDTQILAIRKIIKATIAAKLKGL